MKIIRVTQNTLKRLGKGPFILIIRPDLNLEALAPKISSHPLTEKNRLSRKPSLFRWFLPEGFPNSVHPNYSSFTMWTFIQGISSSLIGVLSTQAMLGTLMEMSSISSETTNEFTNDLKNSAAATINWILKDGLGQAGGIALVGLLGSRLDCHARTLRFHSTLFFLVGSFLEFSIPFVCNFYSVNAISAVFLVMASTANVLKNVSWMLVSATRAHFMKHFALKGNLGDLTGKAASQMTCSSLIGTGLGLLVLKCFPSAISGSFILSSILGLFSTYKSCKVALSRQLNIERVFQLIETLSKQYSEDKNDPSRYIWTPEILAERENFIWTTQSCPKIVFNAALNQEYPNLEWISCIEELERKKYIIAKSKNNTKEYFVWFLDTANNESKLNSIISVALDHFKLTIKNDENIVIDAMRKQGWDIEHFNCLSGNLDGSLKILNKEE